jgi:hypothetical protein
MYFEASRIDLIAFNIKYLETINILHDTIYFYDDL